MTLLVAVVIAVLFGCGAMLMLRRDLIRVIAGIILLGNAANLFIMSAGLSRGDTQMLVRASAGHEEEVVKDLRFYRDFFTALEKSMFLTAHEVD